MGKLSTDFRDDILSEKMNGRKRVKLIPQEDGTYIIEDVTEYTQIGSSYGQKEINLLNSTVNEKLDSEKVIDDLGTALAVTEEGVPVGCKAISALNSNLADSLGGLTFGVDAEGNPGYIKAGADTVTPFKSGGKPITLSAQLSIYANGGSNTNSSSCAIPTDNYKQLTVKTIAPVSSGYPKSYSITINGVAASVGKVIDITETDSIKISLSIGSTEPQYLTYGMGITYELA